MEELTVEFHHHPGRCNDAEHPVLMTVCGIVAAVYANLFQPNTVYF